MDGKEKKSGVGDVFKNALRNMRPQRPDLEDNPGKKNSADQGKNLTGDYEGEKPSRKQYGAQELDAAEKNATGGDKNEKDEQGGLKQAQDKESNPGEGGYYKQSADGGKGQGGKLNLKGGLDALKGKGPIATIISAFLVLATFFLGGQAMMPFSILSQFQETLDSIKVSNEKRTKTMWAKQMQNSDVSKNPIHKRYFGFGGTEFKVQDNQRQKLMNQGIYVAEDFAGSGKTAMLFDDGSGKLKIVAANEGDVDAFRGIDTSNVDLSRIDPEIDLSNLEIDVDNVNSFKTSFNEVPLFRNGYIAGSKTWRGSVGSWFDNITVRFLQSNNLTRNRFKNFQERVRQQNDGNPRAARRAAAQEAMATDSVTLTSEVDGYVENDEPDPDTGERTASTIHTSTDMESSGMTKAQVVQKLQSIANGKYAKAASIPSEAVNIVCGVFDVIGAINLVIVAQEAIQILQVTSGYFEATDKVKAGDGNDSPVHALQEALTMKKATKNIKDSGGDDVEEEIIPGKENTTAMNSAGMVSLYSNKPVDTNDGSVKNFNIGEHFNSIWGALGTSVTSFASCSVARMAAAVVGLGLEVVEIVLAFATRGASWIMMKGLEVVAQIGVGITVQTAISAAIEVMTPIALKWFMRDLVSDLGGEDLGNAIYSGANMYMGGNHLQGGGSLASQSKYVQFAIEQQSVLAEEARFERETRSPFDITSPHTFMGSIMNRLAAIQTTNYSTLNVVNTIGSMVSSSVVSLLPSASAYDVAGNLTPEDEYQETCPWLASIGAVGDSFCNPYMITDVSTIEDDPLEVVDKVQGYGNNLDDDGDILSGGNLANYIESCSRRGSSFGVADGTVAGRFSTDVQTGDVVLDTAANATIGAVPILGDLAEIFGSGNQLANIGWIDGEYCVAKNSGEGDGKWNETKIYQRYIEDQRYLESVNPDYKSTVTAYMEKLDAENPIDTSYEGILAYKSGLTKSQVVDTLAILDYFNYINNYDPGDRIAFGEEEKFEKPLRLENESETKFAGVKGVMTNLMTLISFADVRNRAAMV